MKRPNTFCFMLTYWSFECEISLIIKAGKHIGVSGDFDNKVENESFNRWVIWFSNVNKKCHLETNSIYLIVIAKDLVILTWLNNDDYDLYWFNCQNYFIEKYTFHRIAFGATVCRGRENHSQYSESWCSWIISFHYILKLRRIKMAQTKVLPRTCFLSSALIGQSYIACLKHVTLKYGSVNFR